MRRIFLIALSYATLSISPCMAATDEEESYAAFEHYCLNHLENLQSVKDTFSSENIAPLPPEETKLFLAPQAGDVWLSKTPEGKAYTVFITDKGVCGMNAPYVMGRPIKTMFESKVLHKTLSSNTADDQTLTVYAASHISAEQPMPSHALVSIRTGNTDNMDGIMLSAIPEKALDANGIKKPVWP